MSMNGLFKDAGSSFWADREKGPARGKRALRAGAGPQCPIRMEGLVRFVVGGREEQVFIDPDSGPVVLKVGGGTGFMSVQPLQKPMSAVALPRKRWVDMTSSEQEVLARLAAKCNQGLRDLKGSGHWTHPECGVALEEDLALDKAALDKLAVEQREARCSAELAKPATIWTPITLDTVNKNHDKKAPGMIYGLEFPWSEELLRDYGAKWLTDAFRAAGTLDGGNKVMQVMLEKRIKITAGNNAGKFLFEVKYAKSQPNLHTKLFAKVPFTMTPATKTDRLSSSVYKQPMDLCELQTYRLFEASLPVRTPKFYYGDISNETSNFVLITERIPYAEIDGRKDELRPFDIEGPYDKCKDFQLRGSVREYYLLLMRMMGRIAGAHKSGRFASEEVIAANLTRPPAGPENPMAYGFNPTGASGEPPESYRRKLDTAVKFFGETARVVFPSYAREKWFHDKFAATMLTWSAYQGEIEYFKIVSPDYVALGHNNLNVDNAYFWRDEQGVLDCGVIDWGGFGVSNLGHKIYWILNCSDFEHIEANLTAYIEVFIAAYHEHGGPLLDAELVRMHIFLTAIANLSQMMQAIPNCFSMCAAKEWETIKDRHDPRISENINGKSTLRSTLRQVDNGLRFLEELQADRVLERWIQEVWVGQFKQERKPDSCITGT
mmetsp:Transcript_12955/g.40419  ORF Transcript_12955/g.40419 Transcript_12955/m.40419 type:complete len:662 (+) Transcript_12955:133-2118(+)